MSLNVLIVDDSATTRAIIAKTLSISGLPLGEIYQAGHGKEALEVVDKCWVDLILADINMPVMNGVEMVERLHARGVLASVPVVVVSTDGSAARQEHLKSLGVRSFVRKPFAPELVRNIVQDLLGLKKGA
ncbi:MAG: response regulator [Planctomycetota bacterium]|nr:response regulator [Planctomycetota bacterium]